MDECNSEPPSKMVDVPQFAEETVELEMLIPQERVQWIDKQMVEVFSGKEEFLTKMDELRTQLDQPSKKIDALWVHKARILDQIEDRFAEGGCFDPCLFLNDEIRFLMEEKKGYAAALERLMSERQQDYGKGIF